MPTAARTRTRERRKGLGPEERKYWIQKAGYKHQTDLARALREEGRACADTTLSAVLYQRTSIDGLERRLAEIITEAMRNEGELPADIKTADAIAEYVFPERLDP
jgi:hypothetical protein